MYESHYQYIYDFGYIGEVVLVFIMAAISELVYEGIKYAKPGNRIGDISHAIGEFVRENGYSVVREFQGHGIGREMHEDPGIPNYGKVLLKNFFSSKII